MISVESLFERSLSRASHCPSQAVESLFKEANITTRNMSSDNAEDLAESFASCGTDDILQMPRANS